MQEGGYKRAWFNSSGPLRGGKRDMYEGGIRTPLIAWWPGWIEPSSETDHVSAFWDFLPTACQLAGIDAPKDTDGISFLSTLLKRNNQKKHDYLYWEFYEQGGKQAVRADKWKAVRLQVGKDPDGPLELYNLAVDLGETENVANAYPEIAERLSGLMAEAHVESEMVSFAGGHRNLKRPEKATE
jgi:arylsulfatase A-like enzyme